MNETAFANTQSVLVDHPRQKIIQQGIQALSDPELLAMLLVSGTKEHSALSLGISLLQNSGGNFHELGKMTQRDLMNVSGIGEAKALSIISAFEIGRRRNLAQLPERHIIRTSEEVYQYFSFLSDLHHEEFWLLLLRRNHSVLGKQKISSGGMSGTVADPKIIFKTALEFRAASIVLCHNHPSGDPKPSGHDLSLTRRLYHAGKLLDLDVKDHLIIGENCYYSFSDEGLMAN